LYHTCAARAQPHIHMLPGTVPHTTYHVPTHSEPSGLERSSQSPHLYPKPLHTYSQSIHTACQAVRSAASPSRPFPCRACCCACCCCARSPSSVLPGSCACMVLGDHIKASHHAYCSRACAMPSFLAPGDELPGGAYAQLMLVHHTRCSRREQVQNSMRYPYSDRLLRQRAHTHVHCPVAGCVTAAAAQGLHLP
jgi:hypothetical protein